MDRDGERLGRRQAWVERTVDEQAPYSPVVVEADEFFDVDTSVTQRAAFAIGFGDLGLEGDDAPSPCCTACSTIDLPRFVCVWKSCA